MTVRQAAESLGCSERTVLNYLRQGKLKGKKQGKRWVVEADTVAELVGDAEPEPTLEELSEPFGKEVSVPKSEEVVSETSESDEPELAGLDGKKWSYRHLAAFNTLFPVVRDALSLLIDKSEALPEPISSRAIDSGLGCLQRLGAGYHAYRHRDKVARYQEAREAVMSFSVALYLAGHLSRGEAEGLKRYSAKVERAGARLSGLIRTLERKHDAGS